MNAEKAKLFLLGMAVALLGVLAFAPKHQALTLSANAEEIAQSADGNVIALKLEGDKLAVLDASNLRLALYSIRNGTLLLTGARNIRYDLQIDSEISAVNGLSFEDVQKRRKK